MEDVKKYKFYIFARGFIFGVAGTVLFMYGLYEFNIFYEQLINNNSKYIKKTDINSFIEKQNKIILDKNIFIIKTDLDKYLEEKNIIPISKKEKLKLDQYIDSLELELKEKNKIIQNLNQTLNKNTKKTEKIYYASEIKEIPLYFIKNTKKLDTYSKNDLLNLQNFKLHKSVVLNIEACLNGFETYNNDLAEERINVIKNTLKGFVNSRKIRINDENIIKPIYKDPDNKNMLNEKDENLVLGVAILFNSEY